LSKIAEISYHNIDPGKYVDGQQKIRRQAEMEMAKNGHLTTLMHWRDFQ
jgi:hypothetical protein